MLENVSVGQAVGWSLGTIAAVVALIKGLEYLFGKINEAALGWMASALAPTNEKIDELNKKIEQVDQKVDAAELEDCKTDLVRFIAALKNNERLTDTELERFHETYKRYTGLGGNSYIKREVEKLQAEGKL